MAYTQIKITVKQPSPKLEAFVRELGVKKNEHLKEVMSQPNVTEKIHVK